MKLALIVLSGFFAAISLLKADVPPVINYQGFVTDSNGNPIGSGAPENRKIVFRIYDDANAGNRLWTEEHTVTLVNGQFSILLGAGIEGTGTAAGESRPSIGSVFQKKGSVGATGGERYIGLTVDNGDNTINGSDTEIAPRQRITSTAFALRAETADRVATNSDLFFTGDSNHGVGWYGLDRVFNGVNVNGPVLYGYDGGVLGSVRGSTQTTALSWSQAGDVSISNDLATVGLTTSGNAIIAGTATINGELFLNSNLRMKGNTIYLHSNGTDSYHGLKYTPSFASKTIDGPALFGFSGGVLGMSGDGEKRALQWSTDGNAAKVFVNGKLGVGVEAPSKALEVNGEMSTSGKATLASLQVTGATSFDGKIGAKGLSLGGFSAQAEYVGTAGNEINFGDVGSEDSLSYKQNTFYFKDSALGGDVTDPNVVIGGSLSVGGEANATGKVTAKGKAVAVGEEELRIIRGTIKADGTIYAGSGFKVTKSKNPHTGTTEKYTGIFLITFDEAFSGPATVTATPYDSGTREIVQVLGWDVDDADNDDNPNFGAFDSRHDPQKGFRVDVRETGGGNETYHAFTFIAIGPR